MTKTENICSCCGKIFINHTGIYIIWVGSPITLCNNPCTITDFVSSQ